MKSGLVVEDLPATRRWLGEALEAAFPGIAVKSAATRAAGLALASECGLGLHGKQGFDVALVDIDLPDGTGVDVIAMLRDRMPQTVTIVTTIFDDDAHVFPAMLAGARGYLLKEQPREQFVSGLQGILRGEPPLSPAIARRMIAHFNTAGLVVSGEDVELTSRETEVLRLVAKGLTHGEIATLLGLSRHTIIDYIKSLYRKLNVSSRAEAAVVATRRGLVR
ncbi:MAG: response regulator transcription factor [Burkholderiaceae bacterium]|nr:response regulator transcription factor [Sulfuritalea sp.]MCF8176790.1 response regulator transcription factor [Burkholderiaceae bacterium]MCF8184557.1 response regulator transcription factor [Polynucleobacter sp.]